MKRKPGQSPDCKGLQAVAKMGFIPRVLRESTDNGVGLWSKWNTEKERFLVGFMVERRKNDQRGKFRTQNTGSGESLPSPTPVCLWTLLVVTAEDSDTGT